MSSPRAGREPDARSSLRWMLVIVALAGLLRAGVAIAVFPVTPLGDELYYMETGIRIARGEGHVFGPYAMKARWPPGQAFLLSRFVDTELAREDPALLVEMSKAKPSEMQPRHRAFLAPLVAVEVLLGTAVVALAAALGAALFGPAAGVAAACLAALHPTLVASSHYLWSEMLFTVLLSGGLLAVVLGWRRPRWPLAVAAGVLFGLSGLTREVGLLVGGAAALWWVAAAPGRDRRATLGRAALLVAAMVVVVLPWTVRNTRALGRVVPVSTVGWMGLREGNTLDDARPFERDWDAVRAFRARYVSIPDELERMDVARSEALELIREEQPGWLPRKLVLNLGELFAPGSDLLYKLQQGAYGPVSQAWTRTLLVATIGYYAFLCVLVVLGVAVATGPARWLLPVSLAPVLVVHVVANAFPKYRVPLLPLATAYAALAVTVGLGGLPGRLSRGARVGAGATLAVLLLLGLRYAPEARSFWRHGAPADEPPAAGAAAGEAPDEALAAEPPTRPGRIILLSMDTVRADQVSGYGDADTTPAIARLAAEGAIFREFYAASNYTIPSHMSIFTGLDPEEHGVMSNEARLDPAVPTLTEVLRRAGYHTRGFHEGGYVEARFGFARGFETYRRYPRVEVVRDRLPAVLAWVRSHRDEPWFLFLHTYAAHFPYGGFERYRAEHPERGLPSDEELAALRRRFDATSILPAAERRKLPPELRITCTLYNQLAEVHGRLLPCGDYVLDDEFRSSPHYDDDLAAILQSYDDRIGLVDAAVAALRATLEELGLWEDTLLIVTSDHGEAFYEHGMSHHDYVPFDEVMHVPLIVSYPRWFAGRGGQEVDGLAWHLDLLPTVLGFAGLPRPPGLRGVDLSRILAGKATLPRERTVFPAVLRPAHKPQLPMRRVTVRGMDKRIQGHAFLGSEEGYLFDLAEDPHERHDLRTERPGEVAELDAATARYESTLHRTHPVHQTTGRPLAPGEVMPPVELPPELRQQLHDLGYVE